MNLLFSPHHDDETLFAAFTLLRERPAVVVCYRSTRDYGQTEERLRETNQALAALGCPPAVQWNGEELVGKMRSLQAQHRPERVWAPDPASSHPEHVAVYHAADAVFAGRLTTFHTYAEGMKVRSERLVAFQPDWISAKLAALSCYRSQSGHPRAHVFFVEDLREYYGVDR